MKKIYIVLILVALFVTCLTVVVYASTSFTVPTQTPNTYQNFTFLSATTTTATSTNLTGGGGYFPIAGAKKVTMYFSRGGVVQPNTGSTLFKIEVTPDGTNWYPYNVLTQNSATTTYPAVVSTISISAATSTTITQMRDLGFYAIRCIVVETTDGEHTCKASAEF